MTVQTENEIKNLCDRRLINRRHKKINLKTDTINFCY